METPITKILVTKEIERFKYDTLSAGTEILSSLLKLSKLDTNNWKKFKFVNLICNRGFLSNI